MWTNEEAGGTRVVAMIGPTDVRASSTAVTRTIETIEGVGAPQPIRTRVDAAVMHLDFPDRPTEPAAAYTLAPFISVIAYEACVGPAGVRYLRRDGHGGIARDAMLRRVSGLK